MSRRASREAEDAARPASRCEEAGAASGKEARPRDRQGAGPDQQGVLAALNAAGIEAKAAASSVEEADAAEGARGARATAPPRPPTEAGGAGGRQAAAKPAAPKPRSAEPARRGEAPAAARPRVGDGRRRAGRQQAPPRRDRLAGLAPRPDGRRRRRSARRAAAAAAAAGRCSTSPRASRSSARGGATKVTSGATVSEVAERSASAAPR